MSVQSSTDLTFETDVLSSDLPVLVDFWAEWCGPCRMMGPILDGISEQFKDKLSVVKVNIDENPGLVETYSVKSVPTISMIVNGEVVKQFNGAKSKSALIREISMVL